MYACIYTIIHTLRWQQRVNAQHLHPSFGGGFMPGTTCSTGACDHFCCPEHPRHQRRQLQLCCLSHTPPSYRCADTRTHICDFWDIPPPDATAASFCNRLWETSGGDFMWTRATERTRSTRTSETGPFMGPSGKPFMLLEASGHNPYKKAYLYSWPFNYKGVRFFFHMYGMHMGSLTVQTKKVCREGKCGYELWSVGASHVGVCVCVCVCATSGEMPGFVALCRCITCWCRYVQQAGKCGDLFWSLGASHVRACMCTERGNAGICCAPWVHHMLVYVCAPSGEMDLLRSVGASHVGVCMCTERGNAGICCGICAHHMLVCACAPSGEMQGFVVGYGCITCWCVYVHRAGKCGDLLWGMGASHVGVCMCTERGNAGIRCGVWVHHMLVCVCAPSGEMRGSVVGYGCITCWFVYVHRAGKWIC